MELDAINSSISLIYCGAAVLATFALFARQALPVVYVLLGAAVGPGGFGLIQNIALIDDIAHIGIVFLLFLLGLDLYPQKLISLFKTVSWVAVASFAAFAAVGYGLSAAFGFSSIEAAIAGIAAGFSSTIIGLKLLPTTVLHHRHVGELVIGVLLLQDVIAILALIGIQAIQNMSDVQVAFLLPIVSAPIFVVAAFLLERHILRRLILRFEQIKEYIFLVTIAWCLGCAELAYLLGLNQEIGAFIAGVALAASPISRYIAERLHPIRDFFMVLFFVAIGAHVNLSGIGQIIVPALVLAGIMLVLKPLVLRLLLVRAGESKNNAWEVGFRLGQMSEFSLLVVFVAANAGLIGGSVADYLLLATVLTFIGSSYFVVLRYPTPVAVSDRLRRD